MAGSAAQERRSYRKVYRRLWGHPDFRELSEGERLMALYLLTGPQTNRVGLFRFSVGEAAEDLVTSPKNVRARLRKCEVVFGWRFDDKHKVVWIPTWWKWNPIGQKATNFAGMLTDLNDVPTTTPLLVVFCHQLEDLHHDLHPLVAKWMPSAQQAAQHISQGDAETRSLGGAQPSSQGGAHLYTRPDLVPDLVQKLRTAADEPPPPAPPVENSDWPEDLPTDRPEDTPPPADDRPEPARRTGDHRRGAHGQDPHSEAPSADGNYRVVTRLATEAIQALGSESESDLRAQVKAECGRLAIAYTGDLVARAVAAALTRHRLGFA